MKSTVGNNYKENRAYNGERGRRVRHESDIIFGALSVLILFCAERSIDRFLTVENGCCFVYKVVGMELMREKGGREGALLSVRPSDVAGLSCSMLGERPERKNNMLWRKLTKYASKPCHAIFLTQPNDSREPL